MFHKFHDYLSRRLSLREFTKVADATAILASRGLKPAARITLIVALLKSSGTPRASIS